MLEFVADTTKLLRGYDQAEEVLEDFEKRAEETKTSTQRMERQMDSAGNTARTSGSKISQLTNATEDNADAAEGAAKVQIDLTEALQQLGISADDAEKLIDDLNGQLKESANKAGDAEKKTDGLSGTLGKLGGALSVAGILTALGQIATEAYHASRGVEDLNKNLAVTAGISLAEAQEKSQITESLVDKGYVRENVAPIVGQIVKLYPEWDDAAMQEMAEKYAYFAETQGIATDSIVQEMQGIFDETKWDMQGPEEQTKVLETLYGAISKSTVSFEEFTALLHDGDNAFRMMGMSAEEAIAYIASQDGNLEDVSALINSIDLAIMQKSAELGSDEAAAAWIQEIVDATDGMEDATEIAKILKTELGVENERAAKAFAEALSSGSTEVTELADEIDAASKPLRILDEELRATDASMNRLIESAKDGLGFYRIGDEVADLIDQLDELNRKGGILEIISAATRGELIGTAAYYLHQAARDREKSQAVVNITQNITSPTPADSWTIANAAERGAKAGAKKII